MNKIIVGKIYKTNKCGDIVITEYSDSLNVKVMFVKTKYATLTSMQNIRKGEVKDKLSPSLYGVGIVGDGCVTKHGTITKEYVYWREMIRRCYSDNYQSKQPTYIGCIVSDDFKYFPYFKGWCEDQVGFNNEGWCLDKDILFKGNRVYSEDNCCFVPKEINNLIINRSNNRGEFPVGVYYYKPNGTYKVQCIVGNQRVHLGYYLNIEEAFLSYKVAKESYIKEVDNKWKDQIDPRVYEALIQYKIEITD